MLADRLGRRGVPVRLADGIAELVAEVGTLWHKRHHAGLPVAAVRI
ncbi:hypothetical protein [Streptomyces sp. AC550_RSS872]|nr:hypothetical protein [Streptomyces sp. AC550_RSS872]